MEYLTAFYHWAAIQPLFMQIGLAAGIGYVSIVLLYGFYVEMTKKS